MQTTFLLLHGAFANSQQFQELKAALGDAQVFTFDFYGHDETPTTQPFSIEGFAEQTKNFIEHHNLQEITIIGYSMGGYVAAYLARKYALPISRIVTLATKWNWAEADVAMLEGAVAADKVTPPYMQGFDKEILANLKQQTILMLKNLVTNPSLLSDDFQGINTPLLICTGEKDKLATPSETLTIGALFPSETCRVEILPNTYHAIERLDCEAFLQVLRKG
ncbi:MAG: alpha/beta fold hydrolase [Bacteroidia bacterium]